MQMPCFNGQKYEAPSPLLHYRSDAGDSAANKASLASAGFVVFPALLARAHISALLDEFDTLIELSPEASNDGAIPESRMVRTTVQELVSQGSPTTRDTFQQRYMHEISECFFETQDFSLNEHIFINHNGETSPAPKGAFELHFDQIHTLKFLIYLLDTSSQDGAFRAAPGSQIPARHWRQQQLNNGVRMRDLDDRLHESDEVPVYSLEGPAGTVIAFDTDTFHSAGRVASGRQRKVIRGHTRSKEMIDLVKVQY